MIIKKFQGKTREDALQAAYAELGTNVVEMNVRNVKKKGIFGFLMPQQVEVTVALEDEQQLRQPSSEIVDAIAGVRNLVEKNMKEEPVTVIKKEPEVSPKKSGLDITSEPEEDMLKIINQGPEVKTPQTALDRLSAHKNDNSVIEEKLDNLHTMLEAQLQKPETESVNSTNESEEKAEVSDEVGKFVKLLYNTMLDNEINEQFANQIIEEMEKNIKPNTPFEMALSSIYQKMILKFGNPECITPSGKGPKVVFFVGPTGVGKTTTIAKIASKFSVEENKKVALLTADTYRIAAAEQLHTYANILEIPFRIIYAIEDVEKSLVDFKDYDYVLVDTAGHSHHNAEQREVMNGFIHSVDGLCEKEVFLVLSSTTKYRDLLSIADTYSDMTKYKLIFTKLDETTTLGNLLNLKLHTGAPLSYVTCGQNVPDDIEEFNPQKTVKQLLGGRKN